jgi:lysophospholipase L1-like esterase
MNSAENGIKRILALGDCNTSGVKGCEGNAYPERLASMLGGSCVNVGHEMCGTREGLKQFANTYNDEFDMVIVQFGGYDSWESFKYSPYVLNYPDKAWRRYARRWARRYKRTCKKVGLTRLLGADTLVSLQEYKDNIQRIIDGSDGKAVCLVDTFPSLEICRNYRIRVYNAALDEVAERNQCLKLNLYDFFEKNLNDRYFLDYVHISAGGHEYVAQKLFDLLQRRCGMCKDT